MSRKNPMLVDLDDDQRRLMAMAHTLQECRVYILFRHRTCPQAIRLASVLGEVVDHLWPTGPEPSEAQVALAVRRRAGRRNGS